MCGEGNLIVSSGLGFSKSSLSWPLEAEFVRNRALQRGQRNHCAFRRRSSNIPLSRLAGDGRSVPVAVSAAGNSAPCQFSHFPGPESWQRRRSIGIVYLMRFVPVTAKCSQSITAPNPALNRTRGKPRCSLNTELLHHRHARRLSLRWASCVVREN